MAKKFINKKTKQARLQPPSSPLAKAKLEALNLFNSQQYSEAEQLLLGWLDKHPQDADLLYLQGRSKKSQGLSDDARDLLEQSVALEPNKSDAWAQLAQLARNQKRHDQAEECIGRALTSNPDHLPYLLQQSEIWTAQYRLDEAIALLKKQVEKHPKNHALLNALANRLRETGQLDDSIHYLKQAMAAGDHSGVAYSNYLTLLHYHPSYSKEQILEVAKGWEKCHAPNNIPARSEAADKSPGKRIRLGMFSDGFRSHPVGQMITSTLEKLPKHEIELYAYSTSEIEDHFTKVIKNRSSQWMQVNGYSNERFAELIREDEIDILVDLSGHNAGTFMQAVTLQPAPVIVKWVGGLISSTGVSAIDYLLSDQVETPEGEDAFFTENLVRLPNDYICYTPPPYLPKVTPAPVHQNGYITLGCFNNPTKLNPVLLEQWALLLHGLPNSRLFLKGREFGSEHLRRQVLDSLAKHAITEERVIIEGGSPHKELLASYNKVDIALDPWPYSGGLTTCEAMAMGVPVVTLPGPTFAGRHSATHLVNAGMANLVANDWSEYLFKVMSLANNVDILDNLRTHLRPALLDSTVCDAKLFAYHLNATFRAIWQRYCEGKEPAALSFTQDDQPIFAGEAEPMTLQFPPKPEVTEEDEEFSFTFEGRIVTVDHGGLLVGSPEYLELHNTGAFNTICFDPAGRVKDPQLLPKDGYLHHYPMACLTDGGPATLYLGHDPDTTGSLKPLPADRQPVGMDQVAEVISELPLVTTRLQDVQGLEHVDWLTLDAQHHNLSILQDSQQKLANALLIDVGVCFLPDHSEQVDFGTLNQVLVNTGFKLLKLKKLLISDSHEERNGTSSGQAIFIPDNSRLSQLDSNQLNKLAFLLDTIYGLKGAAYQQLKNAEHPLAYRYLNDLSQEERKQAGLLSPPPTKPQERAAANNHLLNTELPSIDNADVKILKAGRYTREHSKICVGVPIYNEAAYIVETLSSLKKQALDNVHFLIIDNVSTDNSVKLCLEIIGDDERFTLLQQRENRGAMNNFQAAFDLSHSEYFMWLGGHDYLSDNYLTCALAELECSPQAAMVLGQPHAVLNGQHRGLVKEALYDFSANNPLDRYLASVTLLGNCTIVHSLFRRNALHGYEMRQTISGDHVLISHLLWHGRLHYLEGVYYYRRYFEQRDTTQSERISGTKDYLSRHDFYRFYLDNFAHLYRGDSRMQRYLENKIVDILVQRFGSQGLLEHDGLHTY